MSCEATTPKDFLLGLGVAVAVKKPVSTCVVVVTLTLFVDADAAEEVDEEIEPLQLEAASYKTPLMITPSPLMIFCF